MICELAGVWQWWVGHCCGSCTLIALISGRRVDIKNNSEDVKAMSYFAGGNVLDLLYITTLDSIWDIEIQE